MADAEGRHAALWQDRLAEAGARVPTEPSWRARILMWVAQHLGPGLVATTVAGQERNSRGMYDDQPEAAGTSLPADERSHARILREVTTGVEGGTLARFEGRHRAVGGNALRAAVLGANDGLVSNFSLVMGVAGADAAGSGVLIAGFAGLLAGALSMALGEWLSVQSARELFTAQLEVETAEIAAIPEEEEEELRLIYEAKGLGTEQARDLAHRLVTGERGQLLDTLAREELGIDPQELGGSPWVAAATSFFLFAIGALVPVLPFLFVRGLTGIILSASFAGVMLFLLGAGITVVTGRNALAAGVRQLAFGMAAAAITFGIGSLVGRAVG
jgi:VIT1/CCC1 family predicted Fe2+/Mn2+ transporter